MTNNHFSRKMLTLSGRRKGLLPFHQRSGGSWKGQLGLKVYVDPPEAEPVKKKGRPKKVVAATIDAATATSTRAYSLGESA